MLSYLDRRTVTRVTQRPIAFVDIHETPGITFVFDYSGLMKNTTQSSLLWTVLMIAVVSGGVISVIVCFLLLFRLWVIFIRSFTAN